jgi:hypothetical protein
MWVPKPELGDPGNQKWKDFRISPDRDEKR